jgi:hypothetical protein
MAKLDFCPLAFELRCALEERRLADAKRIAVKHLRGRGEEFLNIVAEMLGAKSRPGKSGAKKKLYPPHWLDIGSDYLQLRDAGAKYRPACQALARKYGYSLTQIRNAVGRFQQAQRIHDEAK